MGAAGDNLRPVNEVPSPAAVMGVLYNAIFLDQLDQDVWHMRRMNEMIRELPPEKCGDKRELRLLVIRPSMDLGALAYELKEQLPPTFRYLMNRFGAGQGSQPGLPQHRPVSLVVYIERLIDIGERDGESLGTELQEFVEG